MEQGLVKLNWPGVAVYQPQPRRVRHLFMDALTQYKLKKLNYFVPKMCTHLFQFHHRCLREALLFCVRNKIKVIIFLCVCGIILAPLYKACCNPFCIIHGVLRGADWKMIHGSSMNFLHKQTTLWRVGFGVAGFCFSLVLKGQICSVKCIHQKDYARDALCSWVGRQVLICFVVPVEAQSWLFSCCISVRQEL